MTKGATTETEAPARRLSLWTTEGREAAPFRFRVGAAFAVIAGLHLIGLGLLTFGVVAGTAGAVTIGVAAIAYFRGLVHSFDFDHVSMIDNSTRKFVTEGRNPASVGLAFSAGHSTVVDLDRHPGHRRRRVHPHRLGGGVRRRRASSASSDSPCRAST